MVDLCSIGALKSKYAASVLGLFILTVIRWARHLRRGELVTAGHCRCQHFALCITNRVLHNGVHTMMGFSLLSTSELTLGLSAPATRVTTTRVYVSGIIGNYRLSGFSLDPRFVVTRLKSRCVTSVPGLRQFSSLKLASRRPVSLSLSARPRRALLTSLARHSGRFSPPPVFTVQ